MCVAAARTLRLLLAAVLLCLLLPLQAQDLDVQRANAVKAVYLYRFAHYVDWPDGAFERSDSPIVFGVLGQDPFGGLLDETVAGKRVRGRSIEVRKFEEVDIQALPQEAQSCHILFVAASLEPMMAALVARYQGSRVLTVSDIDRFANHGGMIELARRGDNITFRVNHRAALRAGLKLSAKVLNLAEIVETEGGP